MSKPALQLLKSINLQTPADSCVICRHKDREHVFANIPRCRACGDHGKTCLEFIPVEKARQIITDALADHDKFQPRVRAWLLECFGEVIADDRVERNHRFLEEALELVQSLECTASEAHQLVDYVFGRSVGEPTQEVGGTMVTLAALCAANGLDLEACGLAEVERIEQPEILLKIRAKQAAKPKHSPLPADFGPPPMLAARKIIEEERRRCPYYTSLHRFGGDGYCSHCRPRQGADDA